MAAMLMLPTYGAMASSVKKEIYEKDSYSKLNQPALYSESFSSTVADCCVEERYT